MVTSLAVLLALAVAAGEGLVLPSHGAERVINGTEPETLERFTQVVALYWKDEFLCTATVVAGDTVITAAHCVRHSNKPQDFRVCGGVLSLRSSSQECRGVSRFQMHPSFSAERVYAGNDIAVLLLKGSFAGARVGTTRLNFEKVPNGTVVIAAGYGTTTVPTSTETDEVFRYVDLKTIPQSECALLGNGNPLSPGLLCLTGDHDGSQGTTCKGDSGGPLFRQTTAGELEMVGVLSFGAARPTVTGFDCHTRENLQVYVSLHDEEVRTFVDAAMSGNIVQDGSNACFPAHALVEVEGGGEKKMADLQFGDRVLAGNGEYSEIFAFTHRAADVFASFVRICGVSGHCLELSKEHYLPVNGQLTAAQHVSIGDLIALGNGTQVPVATVSRFIGRGLFHPHTLSGDVVVNGVLASTFTQAVHPTVAWALLRLASGLHHLIEPGLLRHLMHVEAPKFLYHFLPRGPSTTAAFRT
mmetsp:Transcript_7312/g.22296  ORF Transcript_7312/g.22296 Transcript_7312/m.22296 type:complete len:470 (+) Transcript_7312:183-1592(+)